MMRPTFLSPRGSLLHRNTESLLRTNGSTRSFRASPRAAESLPALCATEIAVRNEISLRAHYRIGFEPVERYRDEAEHWEVVAWAWREAAAD